VVLRLAPAPVAVLAAVAASLQLAACGGSAKPADASAAAERTREQQFLRFAKCLREHGINVNTPTGGGPVRIQGLGTAAPRAFEAARNACRRYAPADRPKLSPQERVAREEAVQKFARCMREHGIKLEAKTADGGAAIGIHVGRGEGGPNPESPAFEAAQKACQSLLPKPPGGFKGGPGGPSTSRGGASGGGPKAGFQVGG
jgi:hypothetical protein